jgi:hypothetical protein
MSLVILTEIRLLSVFVITDLWIPVYFQLVFEMVFLQDFSSTVKTINPNTIDLNIGFLNTFQI